VRLGDLSYATYLWHWPLIILLDRTLVLRPLTTAIVVGVAATAIAHVSRDLVEMPARRRSIGADKRRNLLTIGTAIVGTFVLGLALVPAILESDRDQVRAVDRAGYTPAGGSTLDADGLTPVPDDVLDVSTEVTIPATLPTEPPVTEVPSSSAAPAASDSTLPIEGLVGVNTSVVGDELDEGDGCVNDDFEEPLDCVVVSGPGDRILLVGDSHANKMNVIFAEHALENDLSLATVSMVACPWQRGVLYELVPPVEGARQVCRDQRESLYDRLLETYRPDVVVLVSHDLTSDRYQIVPSGDWQGTDGLVTPDLIAVASTTSIAAFAEVADRVVIVEPLPNAPFDVRYCLDAAEFVEECAFEVGKWPAAETPFYRATASADPAVTTVDVSDLVCPAFPRCDPVIDGILVRTDLDHLSLDFTRRIGPVVMRRVGI
jgi:hypothetical protein